MVFIFNPTPSTILPATPLSPSFHFTQVFKQPNRNIIKGEVYLSPDLVKEDRGSGEGGDWNSAMKQRVPRPPTTITNVLQRAEEVPGFSQPSPEPQSESWLQVAFVTSRNIREESGTNSVRQYLHYYSICSNSIVLSFLIVPAGSTSRGGDVTVYAFDINQPSLPTLFILLLCLFLFLWPL